MLAQRWLQMPTQLIAHTTGLALTPTPPPSPHLSCQVTLAKAVKNKVEPSDRDLRTQGTNKVVVNPLRSDAQRQAARGGRDQEAAAAAAGGKGRGGRSKGGGGAGSTGRKNKKAQPAAYKRRRKIVIEDTDSEEEAEQDVDSEGSGGDVEAHAGTVAAAAAGRAKRHCPSVFRRG